MAVIIHPPLYERMVEIQSFWREREMGGLGVIGLSCGVIYFYIGCCWDLQHSLTSHMNQ